MQNCIDIVISPLEKIGQCHDNCNNLCTNMWLSLKYFYSVADKCLKVSLYWKTFTFLVRSSPLSFEFSCTRFKRKIHKYYLFQSSFRRCAIQNEHSCAILDLVLEDFTGNVWKLVKNEKVISYTQSLVIYL